MLVRRLPDPVPPAQHEVAASYISRLAALHGLDITQALSLPRQPPATRIRLVLDGLTSPRSLSHFGVALDNVQLRAEDLDWSYGTGRAVSASALTLALVLSGRQPVTTD